MHTDRLPLIAVGTSLRDTLKATFSPATNRLLHEMANPEPDLAVIASILKLDPALTTSVLALVNSPHYGQSVKITNLQRAALVLGNNEILRIALSLSLQKSLSSVLEKHGFDAFANWRVIIWAAIGAELMAETLCPKEKDTAYLCALVKDLSLLLYAAAYPDELRSALKYPDFVRTDSTFLSWPDSARHHESLTADLLRDWRFPAGMIAAIAAHHDLEQLRAYPPLTQAVILGTRWAEVEFRDDPSPDALGQLNFIMGKTLGLPVGGMEHLRARCAHRFSAMCAAMNITEQRLEDRLYSLPLQSFQDFHYQAREIESLTGGRAAVATCAARHLRWNWNCDKAEIILFSPETSFFERYVVSDGTIGPPSNATAIERFKNPGGLTVLLKTENRIVGELRLLAPPPTPGLKAEVSLYARLLARSYEYHLRTVHALEAKAELLDILPAGVALLTETGRIIRANPRFGAYMREEDLAGQLLEEVLARTDRFPELRNWSEYLADQNQTSHCVVACGLGPKTEAERPCFALSSYKISAPSQTNILVIIQDLTEIQILETEALRQRDFLDRLLDSMQDLVMTTDSSGVITYASGRHARYLRGRNLFEITRPTAVFPTAWSMDYLENSAEAVEAQIVLDDAHLQLELLFSKLPSGPDHGLVVGRDVSSIRRLERRIKEQALLDSLTQVFNRHHLQPILEREIARAQRTGVALGLIFFDIDKFKQFNDAHGHHNGDRALRDLGQILRTVLRKGFDYPCRYGGDEFVIISCNAAQSTLLAMASRIQEQFAGLHSQLTLSIGISVLEPDDTPLSLLERCDKANYQAKASGGNTIVHLQTIP